MKENRSLIFAVLMIAVAILNQGDAWLKRTFEIGAIIMMLIDFKENIIQQERETGYNEGLGSRDEAIAEGMKLGNEKAIKDAIAVIEDGGTGDTILEIKHNGEKFVNERQLIRAVKSLLPNDKEKV